MSDKIRNILIGVALVVVTASAAFLFYRLERNHQLAIAALSEKAVAIEERTDDHAQPLPVAIYTFRPDPADPGRIPLERSEEEISASEDPLVRAQMVVGAVIRRFPGDLPAQARARQVYLLADGTAVVDVSRETAEQLQGGIVSEMGLLASITKSLIENFQDVKRVQFLVEGERRPTFSGHVSISQPFL